MRVGKRSVAGMLAALLVVPLIGVAPAAADHDPPPAGDVLVFSKTAGFRHASIPDGIAAIEALGAEHGFGVDATEDASQFTVENLANYDAVIWLSTTGDVLDAEQEAAFESYIQSGGGYVGIHAASDTEYDWAWYGELVGAYFASHPSPQTATVDVADRVHPSTEQLPAEWVRFDEWYNFQSNPRGDVHVLASLDESSYDAGGGAMGADHPIAWCQDYDGGRSWYTGGGHTSESFSEPEFVAHVLGGIETAAGWVPADCGGTVWDNYEKVSLDQGTSNPMALEVAEDGRVFYIERKSGELRVIDPQTQQTSVAGTLDVFNGLEDGLIGIALAPDFATSNEIYLSYSPADESVNRVSRFTMDGSTLDLASEEEIIEVPVQRDQCCHAGGELEFGPDGDLYLATGDNTNPFASDGYAPIDEREGREAWDAQRSSANTNDLRGKLLRITPSEGGGYTIPDGNLFDEAADADDLTRPEIYAMGLRNPFRFKVDPETGYVGLADYGPDAGGANPDRGPEGRVEWNLITEPGNYGWPYCHGTGVYVDYDFATGESGEPFDCDAPINDSPNNTGLAELPPVIDPEVWFGRQANSPWPTIGTGGAPMGGPFYDYDPELDSETKWPAYFDDAVVFGEWNQNNLYEFRLDGAELYDVNTLLPDMEFLRPMDMEFGPDGSLYLIEWGSGFGGDNADSGVYRIDYVSGSRSPVAVASAEPSSGTAPLEVAFSSEGSRDPDVGDTITYAWEFGDGQSSTEPNPTHTYTENGNYTAQLTVTDSTDKSGVANVEVVVGNTRPTVELIAPADGGVFSFGDQVAFEVNVTDPEDGDAVDCDQVEVSYILGHDQHGHPLSTVTGCDGLITTPQGGHGATENIFGVIEATYTDAGGEGDAGALTGRDTIILQPKRKQAEFFTSTGRADDGQGGGDPGVQTETTGDSAGGGENIGFIEDGDYVSYDPFDLQNIDALRFRVASAGAGGTIEVRADAPDGELLGSAAVAPTGDWQDYVDVTAEVVDPGGTIELFLVFRNDESSGGLFNVNWIDFLGKGVSDNAAPSVSVSADPVEGTVPLEVNFTGEATDPEGEELTYAWDFGDGDTADTLDATHTYTEAGSYTATLTATDAQGAYGEASVGIEVDAPAAAPIECWGPLSDEFDGTELDRDRWTTIVRENQDLRVEDGSLIIPTSNTDIYGAGGDTPNIVLQPLPDGAWTATTKLTLTARDAYQQAGLVVYGDDDNYAKMVLQARSNSGPDADARIFQFIREEDGAPNEVADSNTANLGADYPDTVWVRFTSDGTNLTASYSADGAEFTDMPQTKSLDGIVDPHVGLMALAGSGDRPVIDAAFDSFHLSPDPNVEHPGVDDEFDGDRLDGCRWDQVVRPDLDLLSVGDGQLLLETAEGDIYGTDNGTPPNLILQTAPEGDWTVETKFTEELNGGYSQAGLMAYVDDDNYVKFDVIADEGESGASRIELRSEIDGAIQQPTPNVNELPENDGTWWLRLEKSGDEFIGSYSADGEDWTEMAELVSNPGVADEGAFGVFTLGVNQPSSTTVAFDHFRLLDEQEPVDEVPPVVSASLDPSEPNGDAAPGYEGTYNTPVTVTVEATDEGSGVDTVEYAVNGGEWNRYTEPVTFEEDGVWVVEYRATDVAGNTSEAGSVTFEIRTDACPGSDLRDTVIVGDVDSGVDNRDRGDGCTINDLIEDDRAWRNKGQFMRHVVAVTEELVAEEVIDESESDAIRAAAGRSRIGRK